jgi:hypothetical protein
MYYVREREEKETLLYSQMMRPKILNLKQRAVTPMNPILAGWLKKKVTVNRQLNDCTIDLCFPGNLMILSLKPRGPKLVDHICSSTFSTTYPKKVDNKNVVFIFYTIHHSFIQKIFS